MVSHIRGTHLFIHTMNNGKNISYYCNLYDCNIFINITFSFLQQEMLHSFIARNMTLCLIILSLAQWVSRSHCYRFEQGISGWRHAVMNGGHSDWVSWLLQLIYAWLRHYIALPSFLLHSILLILAEGGLAWVQFLGIKNVSTSIFCS